MKLNRKSLLLYAVTDRSWLNGGRLYQQVEQALLGGATFLQLREKELSDDAFLREAKEICTLCRKFGVPFVVNDNVDIAIACNADGVHVGQSDMAASRVREKIGADKILGVSVQTQEQAVAAERDGADYLGVGTVFATSTKPDAESVSSQELQKICRAVSIPVVAIGGISEENLMELEGSGIAGVAVVSALFAQKDIRQAATRLLSLTRKTLSV